MVTLIFSPQDKMLTFEDINIWSCEYSPMLHDKDSMIGSMKPITSSRGIFNSILAS